MNIFRLTVIKFCIVFFIPLKVYSQSTEIYTDLRGNKYAAINDKGMVKYKVEDPVSSSLIRKLLHQGEVDLAADCLKYEYFLDGIVVGGYQVGRKIGFPTANLSVDDPDKLIPADGVYAVWVTFDKKTYMGMLNIGVRPTIDNGPNRTIEVNILHFHSDIYDKFIRLTFVKRTRPELKFSSIDELIVQLHKDAEETEAILLASKAGSNSRETK